MRTGPLKSRHHTGCEIAVIKKAIRKHEKIVVKAALVGPSASGHVPPASSGDDSEASRLWFCDAATPA